MLPPGRAKLATRLAPTGSGVPVITMGVVLVAFFAARNSLHTPCGNNDFNVETEQLGGKVRQPLEISVCIPLLDNDVVLRNSQALEGLVGTLQRGPRHWLTQGRSETQFVEFSWAAAPRHNCRMQRPESLVAQGGVYSRAVCS